MQKMIKHIFPKEFFGNPAYFRAFVLGMLYVGIVIAQLFSFEKFPDVISGFGLGGGEKNAPFVARLLVVIEIAAVPYLISMRLSRLWRRVSGYAVTLVPIVWLALGLWLNVAPSASRENTGLFGATIVTQVQWWIVAFAALWLWAAILTVRELPDRIRTEISA